MIKITRWSSILINIAVVAPVTLLLSFTLGSIQSEDLLIIIARPFIETILIIICLEFVYKFAWKGK
jgi:hypothetical protein